MFEHIQGFYLCLNITVSVCVCVRELARACVEREREFLPRLSVGGRKKNQRRASIIADVWYYL